MRARTSGHFLQIPSFRSLLALVGALVRGWVVVIVVVGSLLPSLAAASVPITYPQDLYEQPQVETVAFQALSTPQKNRRLIADFKRKKKIPLSQRVGYELSQDFFFAGFYQLALKTIASSSHRRHPDRVKQLQDLVHIGFGLLSPLLAHDTYLALKNRFWGRETDPEEPLEIEYLLQKRFMAGDLQKAVEERLRLTHTSGPSELSCTVSFVSLALHLPTQVLPVQFYPPEIARFFSGYPAGLRRKVEAFCIRQKMNQSALLTHLTGEAAPPNTGSKVGKRAAAYFYGPPGTGKTRFAELTAQAMGLPFARISLEGASISDLLGRSLQSGHATPGLLAQAMAAASKVHGQGAKNMVLFIDEADRVINSQSSEILPLMLKLLDPESKSFFNAYFNAEIDLSHLTIILAGNHSIQDEALRKRLFLVRFDGFSAPFKRQIVWDSLIPRLLKNYSQNGELTLSLEDLTDDDRGLIDNLISWDQDPGFRSLESVLMSLMDFKAQQKFYDPALPAPDLAAMLVEVNRSPRENNRSPHHVPTSLAP